MLFFTILAVGFGLCVGSFLNVVILRLPAGQSLLGRSSCPGCGKTLTAGLLVPVLSYLFLGGRCRFCSAHISVRYPLIELVTGLGFGLGVVLIQPIDLTSWLSLLMFWLIVAVGIATFAIDFEHYLILDVVVGAGLVLGFVLLLAGDIYSGDIRSLHSAWIQGVLTAALAALPLFLLWLVSRGRWLGFGDVKYMLFMGLTLGWPKVLAGFLFAVWLGAAVAVYLLVMGKKQMGSKLPFGVFLVVGHVAAFLVGAPFMAWYWSLLV